MVAFANNDTLGVTTETDIQGPIPFGYSIDGSDGRIMLDISALPGIEDDLINGYASVGGEVILLSIGIAYCDADDCTGEVATSGDIGMWIGICTNCTP